jgi:hypothetical protein
MIRVRSAIISTWHNHLKQIEFISFWSVKALVELIRSLQSWLMASRRTLGSGLLTGWAFRTAANAREPMASYQVSWRYRSFHSKRFRFALPCRGIALGPRPASKW